MQFDSLQAISPVDGRYRAQVEALACCTSYYEGTELKANHNEALNVAST